MRVRLSNTRKSQQRKNLGGESQNRSIAVVNRRRKRPTGAARLTHGRYKGGKNRQKTKRAGLMTGPYPLVTTGGGALPLPTYCAQLAMLKRASTAAIFS